MRICPCVADLCTKAALHLKSYQAILDRVNIPTHMCFSDQNLSDFLLYAKIIHQSNCCCETHAMVDLSNFQRNESYLTFEVFIVL